jgi:hypothetical protein
MCGCTVKPILASMVLAHSISLGEAYDGERCIPLESEGRIGVALQFPQGPQFIPEQSETYTVSSSAANY